MFCFVLYNRRSRERLIGKKNYEDTAKGMNQNNLDEIRMKKQLNFERKWNVKMITHPTEINPVMLAQTDTAMPNLQSDSVHWV